MSKFVAGFILHTQIYIKCKEKMTGRKGLIDHIHLPFSTLSKHTHTHRYAR